MSKKLTAEQKIDAIGDAHNTTSTCGIRALYHLTKNEPDEIAKYLKFSRYKTNFTCFVMMYLFHNDFSLYRTLTQENKGDIDIHNYLARALEKGDYALIKYDDHFAAATRELDVIKQEGIYKEYENEPIDKIYIYKKGNIVVENGVKYLIGNELTISDYDKHAFIKWNFIEIKGDVK